MEGQLLPPLQQVQDTALQSAVTVARSGYVALKAEPSQTGTVPLRLLLLSNWRCVNATKFPSSDGTLPLRPVFLKTRRFINVKLPSSVGIVPSRSLQF